MPAKPSRPPMSIVATKVSGSASRALPCCCEAHRPTASIANRGSRPRIGCVMPDITPAWSWPGWAKANAGLSSRAKAKAKFFCRFMRCSSDGRLRFAVAGVTPTGCFCSGATEHSLSFDEGDDVVQALADFLVAEHEGLVAAHRAGVALHDFQRGADHGRQVDLVDHQQVGL